MTDLKSIEVLIPNLSWRKMEQALEVFDFLWIIFWWKFYNKQNVKNEEIVKSVFQFTQIDKSNINQMKERH